MREASDDAWFRVGAASIGMFTGMALGLCFGLLFPESFIAVFFGGALAGSLTGLVFPEAALLLAEGTVHFFVGIFAAADGALSEEYERVGDSTRSKPNWLLIAFWFGVIYGFVLLALLYVA